MEHRQCYIPPWALVLGLFLLPSSPQALPSLRGGSTTRLALLPAQVFSGRCHFRECSQTEKFKWGAAGRGIIGSPVAEGEVLPRWWASCLALWPVLASGFSVPAGSGDRMKGLFPLHPGGSCTPASLTFLYLVSSVSGLVEIPPDLMHRLDMCPSCRDFKSGPFAPSLAIKEKPKRLLADVILS